MLLPSCSPMGPDLLRCGSGDVRKRVSGIKITHSADLTESSELPNPPLMDDYDTPSPESPFISPASPDLPNTPSNLCMDRKRRRDNKPNTHAYPRVTGDSRQTSRRCTVGKVAELFPPNLPRRNRTATDCDFSRRGGGSAAAISSSMIGIMSSAIGFSDAGSEFCPSAEFPTVRHRSRASPRARAVQDFGRKRDFSRPSPLVDLGAPSSSPSPQKKRTPRTNRSICLAELPEFRTAWRGRSGKESEISFDGEVENWNDESTRLLSLSRDESRRRCSSSTTMKKSREESSRQLTVLSARNTASASLRDRLEMRAFDSRRRRDGVYPHTCPDRRHVVKKETARHVGTETVLSLIAPTQSFSDSESSNHLSFPRKSQDGHLSRARKTKCYCRNYNRTSGRGEEAGASTDRCRKYYDEGGHSIDYLLLSGHPAITSGVALKESWKGLRLASEDADFCTTSDDGSSLIMSDEEGSERRRDRAAGFLLSRFALSVQEVDFTGSDFYHGTKVPLSKQNCSDLPTGDIIEPRGEADVKLSRDAHVRNNRSHHQHQGDYCDQRRRRNRASSLDHDIVDDDDDDDVGPLISILNDNCSEMDEAEGENLTSHKGLIDREKRSRPSDEIVSPAPIQETNKFHTRVAFGAARRSPKTPLSDCLTHDPKMLSGISMPRSASVPQHEPSAIFSGVELTTTMCPPTDDSSVHNLSDSNFAFRVGSSMGTCTSDVFRLFKERFRPSTSHHTDAASPAKKVNTPPTHSTVLPINSAALSPCKDSNLNHTRMAERIRRKFRNSNLRSPT